MSRIRKVFTTDTLKGRLRFFIINLILFVVLIISVFLMFMTKAQIKTTYVKELNSIVKMQNLAIEKWLNERELDIRILASLDDTKKNNLKRVKKTFEAFVNNQSEFYSVSLVNVNGHTILDSTFEKKHYIGDKEFFLEALDGVDTISKAVINKNENIPIIYFTSPVFDEYNEIISLVVASVRLSSIQAIVESFRFSQTGETFIVNKNNQLLTKRKFDNNIKILSHISNTQIKNGFYTSYSKDNVLGSYIKTNFDRWYIVAQIHESEMYEMFEQFITYVLIFILVLLILLMPLILMFSNKIVKPIQFLLRGSQKIEDGDYGHKINQAQIKGATCELRDLTHSFNSMSDVLKSVIDELTVQSTIDMLTKLFNRAELMRLAKQKFENSLLNNKNIAVLMIDIDFFKKINDTYGHQTGDVAIEMVANTIKTSILHTDIAGRYGGEEFVVFIEDTNKEFSLSIAQRIRLSIENLQIKSNQNNIQCTCSIGVFYMNNIDTSFNLEDAIEKADQALYEAKATGRNKVVIYSN